MKKKLLTIAFGFFLAHNAFATGSFICSGETKSGQKLEVLGCYSYSFGSLCSNLTVLLDSKELLEVSREKVTSFYVSQNFRGIKATNEDYTDSLLSLEYFGTNSKKNSFIVNAPTGQVFELNKVKCDFE